MGVGANAWAAAWGCSRERARRQEGDACVRAERARAASSPRVFVPENKISVFCDRGVSHALPGALSPAAPPGESALAPRGAERCRTRGARFSSLPRCPGSRAGGVGSPPLAVRVVGSQRRLPAPLWWGLLGWARKGSPAQCLLIFPVLGRGPWAGDSERRFGAG